MIALSLLFISISAQSQNVGIGTTSPLQKLHVVGSTFLNGNVGIGENIPAFPLSFGPALGDKISLWSNSTNSYGFGIQGALLQIHTDVAGADIAFGYGSSAAFTEAMRIKGNGNIGIGTIAPLQKLHVEGATFLNGNVGIGTATPNAPLSFPPVLGKKITLYPGATGDVGISVQGNLFQIYSDNPSADIAFGYDQGGTMTERMRIKANGNVGIGTPSPAYTLDVVSNTFITGNFSNTATSANYYGLVGSCINTPGYGYGLAGQGGYVGVYGTATLSGTGNRYGIVGEAANGTAAYGIYAFASGAATNWAGYFGGNVYTTGTYSSSDRKLKNAIRPLSGALSIINQLNPSFYTFKTAEYKQMHLPEGIHYGLIADEVQPVLPGIVKKAVQPAAYENHDEKNGKKLSDEVEFNAVNYTEMIPILIGAIKEQQVMIEELKIKNKKNDPQQLQIEKLQKQIDELKKLVEKILK
jgi:Chaperone of endosialidase